VGPRWRRQSTGDAGRHGEGRERWKEGHERRRGREFIHFYRCLASSLICRDMFVETLSDLPTPGRERKMSRPRRDRGRWNLKHWGGRSVSFPQYSRIDLPAVQRDYGTHGENSSRARAESPSSFVRAPEGCLCESSLSFARDGSSWLIAKRASRKQKQNRISARSEPRSALLPNSG